MQAMLSFVVIFGLLSATQLGIAEGIWKSTKVVGGRLARQNEIPYIVAILVDERPRCGGAIYNERFILTAAHCVRCVKVDRILVVANVLDLKELDRMPSEVLIPVKKVIVHLKYTLRRGVDNDIAVVELSRPFFFTKGVAPIPPLPPPGLNSSGRAVLAGYGGIQVRKRDSPPAFRSLVLRVVELVIVPRPECHAMFANASRTDMYLNPTPDTWDGAPIPAASAMCAAGLNPAGGTGACQGDSGGPLLCSRKEDDSGKVEKYLCGIASAGIGCGLSIPDVFTEVSQFTTWIKRLPEHNNGW